MDRKDLLSGGLIGFGLVDHFPSREGPQAAGATVIVTSPGLVNAHLYESGIGDGKERFQVLNQGAGIDEELRVLLRKDLHPGTVLVVPKGEPRD
jgi:hypothetical protein